MKNNYLLLSIIILLISSSLQAQTKAVTETGEEVILYTDGTWKYLNQEEEIEKEITTNPVTFEKSEKSTFLLKSNSTKLGFWLNPKKWSFKKGVNNDDAEYELQLRGEDLYAIIITEKVEIPLESFKELALENGREIAPDIQVVKEEYRMVNGLKMLLMQMDGTMQGIKISYYGYYFSNEEGSVQFLAYTSQNLLEEYKPVAEELLNGIVITE
ncbi:hypothetical protein [Aquimarina sp. LLG6339-5]|uniref:hypothetical protein n=1 Tax=Aquimarina sp. LLG6339-5 TaxID=3160830 RepID=UPI003868C9F7